MSDTAKIPDPCPRCGQSISRHQPVYWDACIVAKPEETSPFSQVWVLDPHGENVPKEVYDEILGADTSMQQSNELGQESYHEWDEEEAGTYPHTAALIEKHGLEGKRVVIHIWW